MPFSQILQPLLAAPGALAAAFFDPQGQPIAQVGNRAAVEVLGAYQSVWISQLSSAFSRSGLGAVSELSVEFAGKRTLSALVRDRYYVVVVFERDGVPALARARLQEVRDRLAPEIG